MAEEKKEAKLVVDMTPERIKEVSERGYDIVPLSVLQQPPESVYPRVSVDTDVVESYRENWESYETSPIQAELQNGYVLDGMHRLTARTELGQIEAKKNNTEFNPGEHTIRVVWVETPKTMADFLLDGAARNAKHGLSLNNDDRKKCALWLNRNARPRRGVTEWQEEVAGKLGIAPRTLREWINQDVADERAQTEAAVRAEFDSNDALPEGDKKRKSITQIAEIVGTTKTRVRGIRQKQLKEQRADASRVAAVTPTRNNTDPPARREPDTDTMPRVAERGPVHDPDDPDDPLNQVGLFDRENPIYDMSEERVQRAAMMALDEDEADAVYHDHCATVAMPDQENVKEIDNSIRSHPDNEALIEVRKELDEKAKQSWELILRLCRARQALKKNLQKWVAREARALKREMTIEQKVGGGDNPHEAQRVHIAMQNAPLGDQAELIEGNDKFSIFKNPLAGDGVIVGPTDTSEYLKTYYPIVGDDALKKARVILDGFTKKPSLYDDYVRTVINEPSPNLLRGDENKMPEPQALDPKAGEVGATPHTYAQLSADDHFQALDGMFGCFSNGYKADKLKNLIAAQVLYILGRDDQMDISGLYELFNSVFNSLADVEDEDEEQDAIENAGEEQEITTDDVGDVEQLGIF